MDYIIRRRELKDCEGIARVVTLAWNETYKSIVPDWFLEELKINEKERAQKTKEKFNEKDNHQFVLEYNNEIVGFVNCGKSEDEELDNCGEIFALYILKKCQGNKLGRKLVNTAIEELKILGFDQMIIACLKGNPTNEFYKHIGGKYIKDGVFKRLDLPENIYYFDKI